jgi:hypothetical protein
VDLGFFFFFQKSNHANQRPGSQTPLPPTSQPTHKTLISKQTTPPCSTEHNSHQTARGVLTITITAMLFCPATEREHLELLLASKLWLLLGGPLEQLNFDGGQGRLVLSLHSILIIFSIYAPHLVNFNRADNIVYK